MYNCKLFICYTASLSDCQNLNDDDIFLTSGIKSGDEIKEIASTYAACRILSRECHVSLKTTIDKLIKAKVVPKLVKFLSRASK
jgi:hypothetical protein